MTTSLTLLTLEILEVFSILRKANQITDCPDIKPQRQMPTYFLMLQIFSLSELMRII